MAPSRDRLLQFGIKATVSDRGRELGGWEGRVWQHQLPGKKRQDLGLGGIDSKFRCLVGWCVLHARGRENGAPVLRAVVLLSCLPDPRARAHSHPPHSPSHTQIHTDT